jgi:hypothetical protein
VAFDPDSYIQATGGFDPDSYLQSTEPKKRSLVSLAIKSVMPTQTSPVGLLQAATESVMPPVSMEGLKRLLNPNLGQYGLSRLLEQKGQQVGGAVRNAAQNTAEQIATSHFGQQNPRLAAGIGAGYSTMADVTSDALTPSAFQQALGMETGVSGLKAAELAARAKIGPALQEIAVGPARRALGFTKQHLNSTKSPFEALRKQAIANNAAKEMLQEDAISKTGSASTTHTNALKILSDAGGRISSTLEKIDNTGPSVQPQEIGSNLIEKLRPKYANEQQVVGQILDDVQVHGDQPIPLSSLKELKTRWGDLGYQQKTIGTDAAKIYRKASDLAENTIREKVQTIGGPDLANEYISANKTYGAARNALRGLNNQIAKEMGNNAVSLPSMVMSAGQLAHGNPTGALATAGVLEGASRRGAGILANIIHGAGQAITPGESMSVHDISTHLIPHAAAPIANPNVSSPIISALLRALLTRMQNQRQNAQ